MDKWVLYTQPNYAHPKPTQTHSFDTPTWVVLFQYVAFRNGTWLLWLVCLFVLITLSKNTNTPIEQWVSGQDTPLNFYFSKFSP